MPRADLGNLSLNYAVQGEGDWVVLIGGYAMGNLQNWASYAPVLARKYRVLSFDNRGIGESDAPEGPYSTTMMAADTLALMRQLGIERAHVIGKSLGGAIAQSVALQDPERVRSLVMTSTFARPDERTTRMVQWWMQTAQGLGFPALFRPLLTYFFTSEFFREHPDVVASAEQGLLAAKRNLPGFLATGNAVITHDAWDRLGELTMPALLLCGDEDLITPPRHTLEMAARMPRATAKIYPRSGHGFLTERPESFQLIQEFLAAN